MTQPPPPPPNEPPQGGFGAPVPPPAGGFGAPTPPPADQPQPGYGYPQAPQSPQMPPGQPGQQPGYGYPGQPGQPGQPDPYGQQQAYGQQPPPYGQQAPYGQQQPYTYPQGMPPQGGGGGKLNTTTVVIIAAAVALVLIIGGIWYASSGDDTGKGDETKGSSAGTTGGGGGGDEKPAPDGAGKEQKPADVAAKVLFELPAPVVKESVASVKGSWITDKAYVKSGLSEVVAHDFDKGAELWSIPLSGEVCAASRHVTKDNKTAIAFAGPKQSGQTYAQCTEVGVIDLDEGKLLWQKSVKEGDEKITFQEITIGGDAVGAGGFSGGAAFDVATGKVRWQPKANAEQCRDVGYAGGEALATVRSCGSASDPQLSIEYLNPKDGTPLAKFKMPTGVENASIVSTKPLVAAADVGKTAGDGSGVTDFFSIDEKTGKLKARIAADAEKYEPRCRDTEGCTKVVVGNGRIYLPTEEHEGSGGGGARTNEIVSFDLATGKPTSDRADAGERYTMHPLRMDGGDIIAYKWPPYDKGGQIVSINGGSMKQTVLLENPVGGFNSATSSFTKDGTEYRYADGRLFMGSELMSKPNGSYKRYLALGFGTH
ncbi:PQQ-binding-like beta-propeller repeat protein [Streptomyces spiramyceticus]|uniref:outer membrane protein assembly factor BamB family protein n=1 Tax=Streptomyces spiramyceticus TaxID=299717 RepID=UPI00237B0618|nr:PQQ-binding-like beta-propeller repeat protein [Streptomyces spiramyceticus]